MPRFLEISDSMRVGNASETSLDDLLLSENKEAMETSGNDNPPTGGGDDPNLDNQE